MDADEAVIKKRFGERLRALRTTAGVSQEGLALICGLDRTYIGGIERGERNVALVNIVRIARGLEVSPQVFFAEADEK
ncbi:hypothetical protein ASD21_00805 [Caulobacter sp. Root1455]|uniref:helix-turn-helix domain-containing protein n=1 Tax=Caulobacter sp. Root1455 TaxID=1736465 RepID=UPI0006F9756E|nr:helix-turn-helix transcriptional regulator [Caulobacter sp. Root1455]KQZ06211.1 hypothetical protein ASD21_00805 [Caulobacter sp. Root1455]